MLCGVKADIEKYIEKYAINAISGFIYYAIFYDAKLGIKTESVNISADTLDIITYLKEITSLRCVGSRSVQLRQVLLGCEEVGCT